LIVMNRLKDISQISIIRIERIPLKIIFSPKSASNKSSLIVKSVTKTLKILSVKI